MAIKVQIPPPMRQHTDGKTTVEAAGGTVQTVLESLGTQYPGVTARMSPTASAPGSAGGRPSTLKPLAARDPLSGK